MLCGALLCGALLCCAVLRCAVLCCAASFTVRKGNGKSSDPTPALMALPGMNPDAVKKLRKRKVTTVAGAQAARLRVYCSCCQPQCTLEVKSVLWRENDSQCMHASRLCWRGSGAAGLAAAAAVALHASSVLNAR
jgi:hypothetical protein